jgi:hypothetical protein
MSTKQIIDVGSAPNDGTGDNLRQAGIKINDNFDQIYTAFGDGLQLFQGFVKNGDRTIRLGLSTTEPTSVISGTIAYADGINWNPSSSMEGVPYMVVYNGTVWKEINELHRLGYGAEEGSVLVYKNSQWTATRFLADQDITGGHY